jgi:DNA adenine methylase
VDPFLKWPGGKRKLLDNLRAVFPKKKRLIEPFVGSGAVFLGTDFGRYLLADINKDLIGLFQHIQNEGQDFIAFCRGFFKLENNTAERFYELRETFNQTDEPRLRAAIFLYLNKHGFNGLCRYNKKGKFNVPFGQFSQVVFPESKLQNFQKHAKKAVFLLEDFRTVMQKARAGDLVYCDPPYVPLTVTASFTNYAGADFGGTEQIALAQLAEELRDRGVTVVISNHDTPVTRELYQNAEIHSLDVKRMISANLAGRGNVRELIAVYG